MAAAAIAALLLLLSPWLVVLGALVAAVAGVWAVGGADVADDPGWVVIDEVAGQLLAIALLWRPQLAAILAAFLLFRLFDIAKPGPVGWAERLPGAAGVMADDILAGLLAAALAALGFGTFRLLGP